MWSRTPGILFVVSAFACTAGMDVPGVEFFYIEVRPGLSREIPEWMCDGAACATITLGRAQIAIASLIELRALLDNRSVGLASGRSSASSIAQEGPD